MKIGIIDSGIIKEYLVEEARVMSVENYIYDEIIDDVRKYQKYKNNNIHGTFVINAFHKYLKINCELYVCNVVNKESKGSSLAVIKALEQFKLIKELRIIIMSLSVSNIFSDKLDELLQYYHNNGTLVIVSQNQHGLNNYLSESKYVFSIYSDNNIAIGGMRRLNNKIYSNTEPEFIKAQNGRYFVFMGTSKAAPIVASLIANNIDDLHNNIDADGFILDKFQIKMQNVNNKKRVYEIKSINVSYDNMILFCEKYLNLDKHTLNNLSKDNLYKKIVNTHNLDLFIKHLQDVFNFKMDIEQLHFCDFKTINNLENCISANINL